MVASKVAFQDKLDQERSKYPPLTEQQLKCIPLPTEEQMKQIQAFLPKVRGKPRLNDREVIGIILYIIRSGARWRDISLFRDNWNSYYMRMYRWAQKGIFDMIFLVLALNSADLSIIMIDATYLKAHRTSCSLAAQECDRLIGMTKGGRNTKLHAICDKKGHPIMFLISEGQRADIKGTNDLIERLKMLNEKGAFLADKGYGCQAFRDCLRDMGFQVCIPHRRPPRPNMSKRDQDIYKMLAKAGVPGLVKEGEDYDAEL